MRTWGLVQLDGVLAHSGCGNRTPHTRWLINNFFLKVLEAGKPQMEVQGDSVFGEGPLPGSWMLLSAVSSHVRRDKGALWGTFYEGANPIQGGPIFMT